VIGLFVLPVHYFTHVGLLFFSGVWATNIHDAVVSIFEHHPILFSLLFYIPPITSHSITFHNISSHYITFTQWADFEPIMGAKYHTVHHTHYHYNFGQVSIYVCMYCMYFMCACV